MNFMSINFKNNIDKFEDKKKYNDIKRENLTNIAYYFVIIIIVLLSLLFIEYIHPYFFLQDDNRDFFLPYYIHNYDSLVNGEIALYNFHQFLGTPHLAVGQSAVLYPLVYLSVFLSDIILGHYFGAIDIMVLIHLCIGAVGVFEFLRFFETERNVSIFGALAWSLCGFVIYVSNSWVIVSAAAAYFPWMLLFSFKQFNNPSSKNTLFAVAVRLLLFYAGHIQYFIYSIIFEFLTTFLYVMSNTTKGQRKLVIVNFLKKYFLGYFYVLILSLPLLLPMWHQTIISANRSSALSFADYINLFYPIQELIKDMFNPFIEINKHKNVWLYGNSFGLSFIGYMPIILLSLGIFLKKINKQNKVIINSVRLYVFVRPALLALLWSSNWILNILIYCIPILNRFRMPFKLAFFLDFFLIIIASLILSRFIKQLPCRNLFKNILLILIIGLQIFNMIFLYTGFPFKAFGYHGDKLPLEENLHDKLVDGRIISMGFNLWAPFQIENQAYPTAPSIGFNYATIWGLDYFAGYEVLLSSSNAKATQWLNYNSVIESSNQISIDYLRKAGVTWYIVSSDKEFEYIDIFQQYGIEKKFEDKNRIVYYDENAYPMVINSDGQKINGEYYTTTNCIKLDISMKETEYVVFNFLYNPFFECDIDGNIANITPIDDIHFSVSIPKGRHQITIKYKDPYFIIGTYTSIVFLIILVLIRIKQRGVING